LGWDETMDALMPEIHEKTEQVYDASMFRVCEQCGSCSSACPLTGRSGFNIRRIIRHLELDLGHEIADSPLPWFCTTCGRCEEACPNDIKIMDLIRHLRRLSPARWPPEAAACVLACPAHIDIPEYLRLIAEGKTEESCAVIRERVPFPAVLGRICARFCEEKCRRGEVNGAVAICALKRYAADNENGAVREKLRNAATGPGKRVAVVGAGPAGLTGAFYLARKGHRVTVYEDRQEAGGMMWLSIPAYRLPDEVLRKEIRDILDVGVELRTGTRFGRDFDITGLREQGYQAVFIATGNTDSRKIGLDGSELRGVVWGLDFLYAVKEKTITAVSDRVVVIGGGNVAIDVALTALRLGAKNVTLACLEKFGEMPANRWEIDQALEEGVTVMDSWGPARIVGNGSVSGIELVRCTDVFDKEGRFQPLYDPDTKTSLEADQVILAIGQAADLSFNSGEKEPLKVARGLLAVDAETQATSVEGVFAGGDIAKAPGSVIEAITAGRRAASSIDRYLGGDGNIDRAPAGRKDRAISERREKGFADRKRGESARIPVEERRVTFREVEAAFDSEQAAREAGRCFGCDLEIADCRRKKLS
jgi:NADH-quinone oxidoreductase subunit F